MTWKIPSRVTARYLSAEVTLQPTSKLSQAISYEGVIFNRASSGERVYTVDIINSKTTYQFNKSFAARAIHRYDSSRSNVLLDYLVSYEPVPGTVAYVGYGSLFNRQDWDGTRYMPGHSDYANTQRSLFFKFSYLYRF